MNNKFMREAVRISIQKMRRNQGGPFGAVIVLKGRIIARGWNRVTTANDPTAHAEVTAIRDACRILRTFRLDGCVLYTSCEPCPMCLAAIYWARIRRVFFGNTRRDAAQIAFEDDTIYRELAQPASRRRIRMKQILRNEAIEAFKEWRKKPDRVMY
jgi:tRNA(Arg) A34 adenosine deaminase TadA